MQRDGDGEPVRAQLAARRDRRLGLSAALDAPARAAAARDDAGAARRRSSTAPTGCASPGPNCQVVVAYTGAVAPEAIEAVGLMAEDRRDVGLLAVTSADRLNAGWTAAQRARERGLARCALAISSGCWPTCRRDCGIVTVLDGHPATLAWLGAVARPPRAGARRRAFRPDRLDRRPLPRTTASTPMPSSRRRRRSRPAGRSGI